ncbi:sulfotransferase [Aurantiacibacter spongiae]|uniref:sulfotransferase n=1 Tax=Aurantiacibacter spongiae TaxID=2488860 RepID=UPI0013151FA6|nr:sulfotransferase [Aurantiacibacter spongiae]
MDKANDWLESLWRRGWCERPSLDPDALWSKALRDAPASGEAAGRSADDTADFRLRLERLACSLTTEARLNPLGRTIAHGQLTRVIRQRLLLGALWADRPEILEGQLTAPIIVVGQMRSGTTRIHRLLAADPAHAATRFCDSWHPVPAWPDTRPAWSALSLLVARWLDPWIDSIHPFGTTRADEELGWLAAALDHCAYETQWRVPGFTAFSEARDATPVYREFERILRTDAHFHGNSDRPRVLKVPQFAEDLPALLARFPESRVVRTGRDADDTAGSSASLVANQMTIQSDNVDCDWIASEVRRKIALREQRMDDALNDFGGPFALANFQSLNEDWEAEIRRIYTAAKLVLTPAALEAMQAETGRSSEAPHRQHGAAWRKFAGAQA